MAKKKRNDASLFSPFVVLAVIITVIGFGAMWIGLQVFQGAIIFDTNNNQAVDSIAQINPDLTQIPATSYAITPDDGISLETFTVLLADLNTARIEAGLNALRLNSVLSDVAAEQASYNASNRQITHTDASGQLVDTRVEVRDYNYSTVAENLLSNWSLDGHVAYEQWRNSPLHQANMMKGDFTEIGIAYYVTSYGQVYFAMVLAHPQT